MPLWKLKLTEEEYTNLKETLAQNAYRLEDFGIEAALCYAEWWRRDYNGGIPSREDVAVGLGLPHYCWEQLYKAARHGLKSHGFAFIHSLKGNEYFRTLLNQGGLPVNYIKNGTNLSGFSRFLIGLVEELSSINIDWDDNNIDLIKNFNCIAYLGKAFKNDNIYDVSLQIAHAIISEEDRWLPYDDTDSSLSELTKSLKREYRRVKSEHRTKPLSLSWKLRLTSSETANLFVNLNIVKEISSKSIEGLNYQSCYTFDVFVSGILVGKYVRKSLVKDDEGEVIGAIYSRITVGVANDIKWSGEPVVEVKIRCDNDDRLFPTLCGSYPPNFECPQVFQMLDDNVYSLKSTVNAENNIAVFSTNWKCDGSHKILLNGELYSAIKFTDKVDLHNCMSNEDITITNEFTPYSAEFRGTYIQWVEQSNFKLLTRIPVISVFDQTGTRVGNIKPKYRIHNSNAEWRNLSNSCLLPFGLVDIKVEFPDNKYVMETFYLSDRENLISFQCNSCLKGLEYLSTLIDATINHQPLEVSYTTHAGISSTNVLHPYYMKQYNNRWFIFGRIDGKDYIVNRALDRIERISRSDVPFCKNDLVDFNSYFDDIVGVSVPYEVQEAETIILQFSSERFKYIVSKPLHTSQKIIDEYKCIVTIKVIPTRELDQLILAFGPDVEVLAPDKYRMSIKTKIAKCLNKYRSVHCDCI